MTHWPSIETGIVASDDDRLIPQSGAAATTGVRQLAAALACRSLLRRLLPRSGQQAARATDSSKLPDSQVRENLRARERSLPRMEVKV